jgi:hypothetical protein
LTGPDQLTADDRRQIAAHGLTETEVLRQLALFREPPPPARLLRPAVPGDGVVRLAPARHAGLLDRWKDAAARGRVRKFVPASGAATRMFEGLQGSSGADRERAKKFFESMARLPFQEALAAACRARGFALQPAIATGAFDRVLSILLSPPPDGLGYGALPKALVPFHHGPGGVRTPFEEHLEEAVETVRAANNVCRVHFTVAHEWKASFKSALLSMAPPLEAVSGADLEVTFSSQDPSTDTVAVDEENRLFREEDGSLLFRPGGHGALLSNLELTWGDLVYVKNIDNVQPRARADVTILWKRLLAGLLVETLEELGDAGRPVRVCGVVRNEGEPGGGPFWVAGPGGEPTLQIVESSQVDHADPAQEAIWRSATHFNPVDLVCALRAPDGTPWPLEEFADPATVFIARKSKDGRVLKALERPGLWNGAMARWHTVFVEVPIETFTPVKTVFDLLRPEHQPG